MRSSRIIWLTASALWPRTMRKVSPCSRSRLPTGSMIGHSEYITKRKLAAVVRRKQWFEEPGHRMLAEVGADVADIEHAVGIGIDCFPSGSGGSARTVTPPLQMLLMNLCVRQLGVEVQTEEQIAPGRGEMRIDRQGLAVMFSRLLVASHGAVDFAEVMPRRGVVGPRYDGRQIRIAAPSRSLVPSRTVPSVFQMRVARGKLSGPLEKVLGIRRSASVVGEDAEQEPAVGEVGVLRERLPHGFLRRGEVAGLVAGEGEGDEIVHTNSV